ncbi:hypothetical protein BDA96_02G185400 [Sorghum bicolor]|uniref:Uncharacterized protein n=2 Tax=Sorghum bicolor TaxID=4558 RepID=A0A921R507_SORBI|nr:hypothetical protein BDA96_04G092500 [Sorghum bicolor]KAG0543377.1 hypothetical protein BDA96_02G185400 [Sorghum bicolor]KXG29747.1 hypothetical protein SORBI_3004G085400 [Sorghum bicolor]KXG35451.1 hypothetical protein SORBI_3002G175800 [Sorghum bicolor]
MRPPITTIDDLLAAARCCLLSVWTEAAGAGDTAVHSSDAPSDDYMDRLPKFSGAEEATGAWGRGGKNLVGKAAATPWHMEAVADQRVLPFAPSEKKPPLAGSEHELADPAAGTFTQKRRLSSSWEWEREPREAVTLGGSASAASKHKPSPLAEVEFADTRKPITRATDGNATDRYTDVLGRLVGDTVDDSLARAEAMFREAATRGNPEWPHSRALAEMLARRELGRDAAGSGKACWGS